ncbi:ATP-dependent DNA helicase pfh1 [Grifola frondosa]|uniref:ATP-dependent DNA helicase n=1 Tax=Grifola frondosa TaxID=5627 RepID=A0A1C7LQU3_GRIFR|nr:ATP-dependent DNA helicase pfh1 [Grifola frondosa]
MNVLYECADARDDFASQRRADEMRNDMPAGIDVGAEDVVCPRFYEDVVEGSTEQDIISLLDNSLEGTGKRTAKCRSEMDGMRRMLGCLPEVAGAALAARVEQTRCLVTDRPSQAALKWKECVDRAKQKEIDRKAGRRHADTVNASIVHGPFQEAYRMQDAPIVRILSEAELRTMSAYGLHTSRGPQDKDIVTLVTVIEKFTLNEEQIRAFYISAYYLHHHDMDPLYMHLSGVGGTGKSRVLLAIMFFLIVRREEHRFAVWGPTGSSASLIDGNTYHSQLGFGHKGGDSNTAGATALSKVHGRLDRVDLVFLDEISMVCCADLYWISAQMTKAFNDPMKPFGGKSIILAGDVAQLPPPANGSHALYSDAIGSWSSGQTNKAQENSIGKALWQMFTCVVILRKNMRQAGMSAEDVTFRTALDNLRLKACTDADINLFRTRCVYPSRGDTTLALPEFRDVSVITARNHHRDGINEHKVRSFAIAHGKPLHRFHSVDHWATQRPDSSVRQAQRNAAMVVDPVRTTNNIDPTIQNTIWNVPPSLVDHHPGILALCEGMPVLLKHNEATELCATNGAEGVVVGWDAHFGNGNREVLDTLFVELINPPRSVQVEGLPLNVIPLAKTSTVIIEDFDHTKMQGGITGGLRRELQELEILNDITKLSFHHRLPATVHGDSRGPLIQSYNATYGNDHVPPDVHPALDWSKRPIAYPTSRLDYGGWKLVGDRTISPQSTPRLKRPTETTWAPSSAIGIFAHCGMPGRHTSPHALLLDHAMFGTTMDWPLADIVCMRVLFKIASPTYTALWDTESAILTHARSRIWIGASERILYHIWVYSPLYGLPDEDVISAPHVHHTRTYNSLSEGDHLPEPYLSCVVLDDVDVGVVDAPILEIIKSKSDLTIHPTSTAVKRDLLGAYVDSRSGKCAFGDAYVRSAVESIPMNRNVHKTGGTVDRHIECTNGSSLFWMPIVHQRSIGMTVDSPQTTWSLGGGLRITLRF